jgi:16S rRNA processing protein RimM
MHHERIVVAEVLRPRGNRGELLVRSQTDVPHRLETLKKAHAHLAGGTDVQIDISHAWSHKGDWVLKLQGIDSIDAAERFRGADIWVPPAERGSLPEGEFFQTDLLGYSVIDRASGTRLGAVEGWQQFGGPALMEIAIEGRTALVPFVSSICREVNRDARTIAVDLPEGLLDL